MLFTVINYLPLLEEETATKKIEICKKAENNESSEGGGDDETETDSESGSLLHPGAEFYWTSIPGGRLFYASTFKDYFYLHDNKTTPPPRF